MYNFVAASTLLLPTASKFLYSQSFARLSYAKMSFENEVHPKVRNVLQ